MAVECRINKGSFLVTADVLPDKVALYTKTSSPKNSIVHLDALPFLAIHVLLMPATLKPYVVQLDQVLKGFKQNNNFENFLWYGIYGSYGTILLVKFFT